MSRVNPLEKYAYLIGTKINKWTILSLKNDRRHADAICRCECGTVKPVNIRNLINNCTKDCGCGRKAALTKAKSLNLVGNRYGKLVAIELLPESNKFNRRMYRCKCDCGNEIILPSSSLTTHHTSSCGCLISYYNMFIQNWLAKHKIEFIAEYAICIDDHRYRFDFYLPKYNLFIEYDGEHHYRVINYSGDDKEKNEQSFRKVQERDKIKDKYCEDNGINLLRIPYWENKSIETIINNCLQRLNDKGLIKIA